MDPRFNSTEAPMNPELTTEFLDLATDALDYALYRFCDSQDVPDDWECYAHLEIFPEGYGQIVVDVVDYEEQRQRFVLEEWEHELEMYDVLNKLGGTLGTSRGALDNTGS